MNYCELTAYITALSNALAKNFSDDEITLIAAAFVQLGDTLATIAVHRSLCGEKHDAGSENIAPPDH